MGWFLFLVGSRFLGGMIGVVDQGKGIHKNFRTRAVGLLGETRTNIESGNKAAIRVAFLLGVSHETLRGWSRATDAQACFLLYRRGRL